MQVRWHQSLTFKLFALMCGCVLLTVAGITWQHTTTFRDYLDRQLEDSAVTRAQDASKDLAGVLQQWASLSGIAMHRMAGATPEVYGRFVASLIDADPDLLGFAVVRGANATLVAAEAKHGVLAVPAWKARQRQWVKALVKGGFGTRYAVRDASAEFGEGVIGLAMRFDVSGQSEPHWALVTARLGRITNALTAEGTALGWIVDERGRPFAAKSSIMLPEVLGEAVASSRSPFGFNAYTHLDEDFLGAYAKLPDFGLTVVVAQEAEGARLAIMRNLLRTLIWAWIFILGAVMMSFVSSNGLTRHLRALTEATRRIAGGDFSARLAPTSRDEVGVLGRSVDAMAGQIVQLLEAKVEAARQEKELETARLVQERLFPRDQLDSPHLRVAAKCFPASECGGDWWGHFKAADGRHYVFVADATGHGAAAALVTAIAYSVCKTLSLVLNDQKTAPRSPAMILEILNRALVASGGQGETTMTFFAGAIDLERGTMTFANAGHNMPFIVPAERTDPRLVNAAIGGSTTAPGQAPRFGHLKVRASGTPLGLDAESTYEDSEVPLAAGDRLVFYTDGLFECGNPDGKAWGERALRRSLDSHGTLGADELQAAVLADAFTHFAGQPQDDDITVVTVELDKAWQPKSCSGKAA